MSSALVPRNEYASNGSPTRTQYGEGVQNSSMVPFNGFNHSGLPFAGNSFGMMQPFGGTMGPPPRPVGQLLTLQQATGMGRGKGPAPSMFSHIQTAGVGSDMGPLVKLQSAPVHGLQPSLNEVVYPKLDGKGAGAGAQSDIRPSAANELDSMWLAGFLDADATSGTGATLPRAAIDYAHMFPGSGLVLPGHAESKGGEDGEGKKKKLFLNGQEIARIREIERAALDERAKKGPTLQDKLATSAYAAENDRIRRAMSLRGEAGAKRLKKLARTGPKVSGVTSKHLDNLLYLERLEAQAAVVVQRCFRRFLRLKFWATYVEETKAATNIQRLYRGMKGRARAAVFARQRQSLATKLQAMGRGRMARENTTRSKAYQDMAAKDIQRIWRMFAFKQRARRRRKETAATRIQAMWRGAKGRAVADKKYLDCKAVLIQKHARRFLAQKRYKAEYAMESASAVKVQAIFRGWIHRKKKDRQFWDLAMDARRAWMHIIKAEEIWADKEAKALAKVRLKEDLDGKLRALEAEWKNVQAELSEKEYDFVMLQMERIKLSPRAVEQGWSSQLDTDVKQHRKWVTELKVKALFKVGLPLRELRNSAARMTLRFNDLVHHRDRAAERWAADRAELWVRHNEMSWGTTVMETRKRASDEKRKWKVQFHTDSGKIDLARRPGQSRLAENFPAHENRTLTIGHGDILALTRPEGNSNPFEMEEKVRDHKLQLAHALAARVAELAITRPQLKEALGDRLVTWGWGAGEDEKALLMDGTMWSTAAGGMTRMTGKGGAPVDPSKILLNTLTGMARPPSAGMGGGGSMGGGSAPGGPGPLTFDPLPMGRRASLTFATAGAIENPALAQPPGGVLGAVQGPNDPRGPGTPATTLHTGRSSGSGTGSRRPEEWEQAKDMRIEGKDNKMVLTVGRHFAGLTGMGQSISDTVQQALSGVAGERAEGHHQVEDIGGKGEKRLQKKAGARSTLEERVWRTHVSRYAGTGPSTTDMSSKNRQRAEVFDHVAQARAGYQSGSSAEGQPADAEGQWVYDQYGNPMLASSAAAQGGGGEAMDPETAAAWAAYYAQYQAGGGDTGASYGYGPDPYYGYGWGWGAGADGQPAPLLEDGSTAVPTALPDGSTAWPVWGYAGWGYPGDGNYPLPGQEPSASAVAAVGRPTPAPAPQPAPEETGRARPRALPAYLSARTSASLMTKGPNRGGGSKGAEATPADGTSTARPATDTMMTSGASGALGIDALSLDIHRLPLAMRDTFSKLQHAKAKSIALASLPPGLAGARRGAAAATIAASRAKGTVSHTQVTSTAQDKAGDRSREVSIMGAASARMDSLAAKVAAVNAQAELMQYGALAKPLMDGMAHLSMSLAAADATAVVVDRVALAQEAKKREREAKLEAARAARRAQKQREKGIPEAVVSQKLAETLLSSLPPKARQVAVALPTGTLRPGEAVPAGVAGATPQPLTGTHVLKKAGIQPIIPGSAGDSPGKRGGKKKHGEGDLIDAGPSAALPLKVLRATQARLRERQEAMAQRQPELWASLQAQAEAQLQAAAAGGGRTGGTPQGAAASSSSRSGSAGGGRRVQPVEDITIRLASVWSLYDELEAQKQSIKAAAAKKLPFPAPRL